MINPYKRAIYDSVGVKGLVEDGLQIVIRSKTPQEIREEYERISKEKEQERLQRLTFSEVIHLSNTSIVLTNYFNLSGLIGNIFYENQCHQHV